MKGQINFDDIAAFLKQLEQLKDLPDDMRLLYDIQEAELNLSLKEIRTIAELAESVTKNSLSVKTAFHVTKPIMTAFSVIFAKSSKPAHTQRKLFSTQASALEWLQNN